VQLVVGGAVTLGDKFYTFEVDYPSGKTVKTGTTADTTGGGGMRAFTKAGEKAHNREWGARALRAIRAAQAQGADFQPDGDALKALTKFSGDVPEAAIR
jgi:hypothetical protein